VSLLILFPAAPSAPPAPPARPVIAAEPGHGSQPPYVEPGRVLIGFPLKRLKPPMRKPPRVGAVSEFAISASPLSGGLALVSIPAEPSGAAHFSVPGSCCCEGEPSTPACPPCPGPTVFCVCLTHLTITNDLGNCDPYEISSTECVAALPGEYQSIARITGAFGLGDPGSNVEFGVSIQCLGGDGSYQVNGILQDHNIGPCGFFCGPGSAYQQDHVPNDPGRPTCDPFFFDSGEIVHTSTNGCQIAFRFIITEGECP
jgi:hypothetical protein